MFIGDIYLYVFLTYCTGLPSNFLVGVWPDNYARKRDHSLFKSGKLISLQQLLYLHYVMVHAGVSTPAVRKQLTVFKVATASRSIYYSFTTTADIQYQTTCQYLVYGGPSTSATLFY